MWYLLQLGRRNWCSLVFIISSGKRSEFPVSSRALSAAGRALMSSLHAGDVYFTRARDPFRYRGAVEELCCFWPVRGRWGLNSKISENVKKKFKNSQYKGRVGLLHSAAAFLHALRLVQHEKWPWVLFVMVLVCVMLPLVTILHG